MSALLVIGAALAAGGGGFAAGWIVPRGRQAPSGDVCVTGRWLVWQPPPARPQQRTPSGNMPAGGPVPGAGETERAALVRWFEAAMALHPPQEGWELFPVSRPAVAGGFRLLWRGRRDRGGRT